MRKKLLLIILLLMLIPFIPHHLLGAAAADGTCGTNVKYTISGNTIDFSKVNFGSDAFWGNCGSVFKDNSAVTVVNINDTIKAPEDSSSLFSVFIYVQQMNLAKLDVSDVSSMESMFYYSYSLKSLNISGWNTLNVMDMTKMFEGCSSLKSLDVSRWDTSNVIVMTDMFRDCSSLTNLDVSGWNTSNLAAIPGMFQGCNSLSSLDVSGWDTSNMTDMSEMFYGCSSLMSIDVSGWDTSCVTHMLAMFKGCSSLKSLDVSRWDTSNATHMMEMFSGCSSLTSLDVRGWDTSNLEIMDYMFEDCGSLTGLDLSGWDTSNVIHMWKMFSGCSSLKSLDVSGWDTSNVIDTEDMFEGCTSLYTLTFGKKSGNNNIYTTLPAYNSIWCYMVQGTDAVDPLPLKTEKSGASLFTAYDYKTMAGTWEVKQTTTPKLHLFLVSDDGSNADVTGKTVEIDVTSKETISLKAALSNAVTPSLSWKNSAVKVADIRKSGDAVEVSGLKPGTAKITASTALGKKTLSASVTVKVVAKLKPGNITISGPECIAVGKTGKFTAKIGEQEYVPTNKAIVWALGEGASGKVTVSSSGVVTGKAATTKPVGIKACAKDSLAADGTYKNCVTASLNVTTAADSIEIELINGTTTLDAGESVTLKAVVSPADASQEVAWTAKSSKVADVEFDDNGTLTVKALSKGPVTIKAVTTDGTKKSATVKLTVGVKVKDGMLSIKEAPGTVAVKKTLKLTAVFSPVPSNKKVVWNIVEGDANITLKNGTVAGVKPGHAVVQVCSEENPAVCVSKEITVVAPVTSVKLVPAKPQTLDIGGGSEEFEVEAVILPENATIKELNWTSSKPEVAEVDSEGKVTAKGVGTTVITATAADGSKKSAKLTVKVVSKVQEGSLTIEGEPTVELKQTMQMKWSFSQPNAPTNQKLTWKSSAPKVASVTAKGLVKGLTAGTAEITATSVDNKAVTAVWKVTVLPLKSDEPVMADAPEADAVALNTEEPVAKPEEPDVIPEETETAENAAEETTEPHFAVEETWMQAGESVILDVVNPDGAAVMVGLDGDTDAVLWNEELRMLTSIGEAEVTAFLSTIDPVEVKSMMAIHIISAMPEEEEVSEETGEAEGAVTEGGEDGVIESAEPAEGEDTTEAAEAVEDGETIEAVEPSEGEESADTENAAEETADDETEEVSENQEAEEPAEVTETPAAEPVGIIIRDLGEDEALSGEANGVVMIDRERFELDDETLSGLVFEIENESVAKLTNQSAEEMLMNGIEIRLLGEGETKLVIKQEGDAEPLRVIRLVVTAAPAVEKPAEEEVTEPAAEPVEELEEAESREETIVNSSLPEAEAEAAGEEIPAEVPEAEEEPAAE